jgi:hypothetical protein
MRRRWESRGEGVEVWAMNVCGAVVRSTALIVLMILNTQQE